MDDQAAKADAEYEAAAAAGMASDNNSAFAQADALGSTLLAEFSRAENDRRDTEERWLQDLRQYRGVYDPDVLQRIGKNRSKAFVRATRVKVKTVDARVADLLFPSTSDRNWTAESTASPSVDRDTRVQIMQALQQELQRTPTPQEYEAAVAKVVKAAAKRMTAIIDDQLAESRYKETARHVLHSGHLYGTGVLKAPLVERKTRSKFVMERGKWVMKTESYVVPFVDHVPIWRWYPDMSATKLEDCRFVYERHRLTRAAMASLAKKRSFKASAIKDYILANPKGTRSDKYFDTEIRSIGDRASAAYAEDGTYEVLERWGWVDGEQLANAGVTVPPERMHETFFSNIWLLPSGEIIKIVLQPINGVTWPYHLYYADKDETSIFGDGFASIMRDDQTMINAGTRMILDNAALTAGPQAKALPAHNSKTIVFRRYTALDNTPTALTEGVTPGSLTLQTTDVPCVLTQYGSLVTITDVILDTHEDNVLNESIELLGEQAAQMIERMRYGVLRAGTNVVYANGATRAAVNSPINLAAQRRVVRALKRQNTEQITKVVRSTAAFGTESVAKAFIGLTHPDVEPDIRNMLGADGKSCFVAVERYGSISPYENEIGKVEDVRYLTSTIFTPFPDAGGAKGLMTSTSGTSADVYPVLYVGANAYAVIALKGMFALTPMVTNPKPSDSDPMAQRGRVAWKAMQGAVILNDAWMCRLEVAVTA